MRLWSLHPRYLDRQGLTALWREALLAQAVLEGQTKVYRHHPQLARFQKHPQPLAAIGALLEGVWREAQARGYRFDDGKIHCREACDPISVTTGQMAYEWSHLMTKLDQRSPNVAQQWRNTSPQCHPLFRVQSGYVEAWERPHHT
ncbi:MAG: pyrimidine dimer DNA glycosylase/endonuclease V [Firmicutes bacterium]|nr:pyrimidine dimer DNA glycosylase/endonuclease V [Bacillota bacterium]